MQVWIGTSELLLLPQIVSVQLLELSAATGVHEATPTGPVVTGAGQVVVTQLFPAEPAEGVQDATGTFAPL